MFFILNTRRKLKQTRSLKSNFWYRRVSTLIEAVSDLNLTKDPLSFLDISYKQYGSIWISFFICLYEQGLFPPVPPLAEVRFESVCHFGT